MIVRNVRTSKLREYPIIIEGFLSTPKYNGTHVRNGTEVFAGPILGTKFQLVCDYGDIRDVDVMCLKYILATNLDVISRKRMLMCILQHKPHMLMFELAAWLHADPEELRLHLSIPKDVDLQKVCVTNGIMLGKLTSYKKAPAYFSDEAETKSPMDFVPKVHQWIKEHQAERRRLRRKVKK